MHHYTKNTLTAGASLPVVLEPAVIIYHCRVVSLLSQKFGGSYLLSSAGTAHITAGSNHHPVEIHHYRVKPETGSDNRDIIVGLGFDQAVMYPCWYKP